MPGGYLKAGKSKSCGGCIREAHGMTKTGAYKLWLNMIQRCHNERSTYFQDYGGRGIVVCKEWRESFVAWWEHVRELPGCPYDGNGRRIGERSIDRKDNDGSYEPENVRWATAREQQANRRSKDRVALDRWFAWFQGERREREAA